jgi:hypothetical protein
MPQRRGCVNSGDGKVEVERENQTFSFQPDHLADYPCRLNRSMQHSPEIYSHKVMSAARVETSRNTYTTAITSRNNAVRFAKGMLK